jgi:hypothetical protein
MQATIGAATGDPNNDRNVKPVTLGAIGGNPHSGLRIVPKQINKLLWDILRWSPQESVRDICFGRREINKSLINKRKEEGRDKERL